MTLQSIRRGVFLAAMVATLTPAWPITVTPAAAQQTGPSDRSVKVLMEYAWTVLPQKFTSPSGKVIEVDKRKKKEVLVPMDVAREVIRVARLTAHAQICELPEEQIMNHRVLMYIEQKRNKWTDQQLLYINQLHLFTVMWLTGKVKLVEKDGDKEVVISETNHAKAETCSETQRAKVKETILAYVAANDPKRSATSAGATATPAAKK